MFDSVNITPDCTGTFRALSGNISQALSSYIGNIDVSKFNQKVLIQGDDSTNSANSSKKSDNNQSSDLVEVDDYAIDNIGSDDDEDSEYTSILNGSDSSITTSFDSLAAAVGASTDKVSKEQLFALLQSLISSNSSADDKTEEITFLKNLIAKFDTISDGANYISSFNGIDEPQDYETITQDQVTSPIDLRV